MTQVNLTIAPSTFGNQAINETFVANPDEILGICAILYALFGDSSQATLYDVKRGLRKITCSPLLSKGRTILMSGEDAFEADPDTIVSEKQLSYAVRVDLPSSSFVFQFTSPDSIRAIAKVLTLMGLPPSEYLSEVFDWCFLEDILLSTLEKSSSSSSSSLR